MIFHFYRRICSKQKLRIFYYNLDGLELSKNGIGLNSLMSNLLSVSQKENFSHRASQIPLQTLCSQEEWDKATTKVSKEIIAKGYLTQNVMHSLVIKQHI